MNTTWLKALVLILVFATVVFAVERFVSAAVGRRMKGRAINQRLDMINRGAGINTVPGAQAVADAAAAGPRRSTERR